MNQPADTIIASSPLLQVFQNWSSTAGVGTVESIRTVKEADGSVRTYVNITVDGALKGSLGSIVTAWYAGGTLPDGSGEIVFRCPIGLPTVARPMTVIGFDPGMRVMFFILDGEIGAAVNEQQ
jgi:hypothetical protein